MSNEFEHNQIRLGLGFVRFEPPDVVISRVVGTITVEEARATTAFLRQVTSSTRAIYWIANIAQLERYPSDAARVPFGDIPLRAVALVGGTYRQNIIVLLINKASKVLKLVDNPVDIAFFSDDDSARVWIDTQRVNATPKGRAP